MTKPTSPHRFHRLPVVSAASVEAATATKADQRRHNRDNAAAHAASRVATVHCRTRGCRETIGYLELDTTSRDDPVLRLAIRSPWLTEPSGDPTVLNPIDRGRRSRRHGHLHRDGAESAVPVFRYLKEIVSRIARSSVSRASDLDGSSASVMNTVWPPVFTMMNRRSAALSTPEAPPPIHMLSPFIQTSGCIGGVIATICLPVTPPTVTGSGPETTVDDRRNVVRGRHEFRLSLLRNGVLRSRFRVWLVGCSRS